MFSVGLTNGAQYNFIRLPKCHFTLMSLNVTVGKVYRYYYSLVL